VNLLFMLSRFDEEKANQFREPFRFAAAAGNIRAMFILDEELDGAAAEAFAQKFADIRRRHVVLHGVDPFPRLTIERDALARRLRQVLLNLTIRLREMYMERSLRAEQCAVTVAETAAPLRTAAATMVELETGRLLKPKEALSRIVREINRPEFTALLPHISEAREQRALPAGKEAALLFDTLELARALHARSMRL
jgi:predicted transcriptional regulator